MLALLVAPDWARERARRVLDAHRRGLRVFQVVAGNRHDVYALAAAAKAQGLDPSEALRASVLARAFTAHQLAALLEDTLPLMMADRLGLVAVVDPLDQYASEEVGWEEGMALLQRGMARLRLLARRRPEVPVLVVQRPGVGSRKHWEVLTQAVEALVAPEPAARARQLPLSAWLPQPREVMPPGPHPAHVPQPA